MTVLDSHGREPLHAFHLRALQHWLRQSIVLRALRTSGRLPRESTIKRLYSTDRRQELLPSEAASLVCKVLAEKRVRKVIAQVIHANARTVPVSYPEALAQLYELYKEALPLARVARSGLFLPQDQPLDPRGGGGAGAVGGVGDRATRATRAVGERPPGDRPVPRRGSRA